MDADEQGSSGVFKPVGRPVVTPLPGAAQADAAAAHRSLVTTKRQAG